MFFPLFAWWEHFAELNAAESEKVRVCTIDEFKIRAAENSTDIRKYNWQKERCTGNKINRFGVKEKLCVLGVQCW